MNPLSVIYVSLCSKCRSLVISNTNLNILQELHTEAVDIINQLKGILQDHRRLSLPAEPHKVTTPQLPKSVTGAESLDPDSSYQQISEYNRRSSISGTRNASVETPLPEHSAILSKLDVLQGQQQHLSDMIDRINETVVQLETRPGGLIGVTVSDIDVM